MNLLERCGFETTRKTLLVLNALYLVVAVLLISTGAYAHNASIVTSVSIAGGVIAVGVFLLCVAILGIYGTRLQHQAALFFYMVVLVTIFVVQFCVACACFGAISPLSLKELIVAGWRSSSPATIWDAEKAFGCCGLSNVTETVSNCKKLACWSDGCLPCLPTIEEITSENLQRIGTIGLLFSFTELLGVVLAYRFRNTKNPRFNPHTLFT